MSKRDIHRQEFNYMGIRGCQPEQCGIKCYEVISFKPKVWVFVYFLLRSKVTLPYFFFLYFPNTHPKNTIY
ncbi:hypothetical protein AN964_09405 [Heyndrickxia shackletonii]|uniref:Uncharacterized protein n=1 Tax=Heyndrickxia shackletonii TaxID=157838 RepID=A0A0Q3WXH2_9BACI|nr:hypothetical protein AN964_09405 [Heyndrickxia shackletonii]